MAAPGPNIAPAGANQSILLYAQDEANDLLGDNISLTNLEYTGQGSTAPANLRTNWTSEAHNGILNCLGTRDEAGNLYLLSAPTTLALSILGVRNHPDEGKLVGILGDLLNGVYYDYYIPSAAFNRIANTINCLSGDQLCTDATAFAAGGGRFTSGPHQDTDAGVTPTNTRKLFMVPFFLIQHFMALPPDADVGLAFFKDMYPLIVAKGLVTACKSLIDYMRVLVTLDAVGSTTSLVDLTSAEIPTPIGRNPEVVEYRKAFLQRTYPNIFVNQAAQIQNQGFTSMAAQQDAANQIARDNLQFQKDQATKRTHDKLKKAVGGSTGSAELLRKIGKQSLNDLPPVIKEMIEAEKGTPRDAILKKYARKVAEAYSCAVPPIMTGMGDKILQGSWHMEDDTSPETGSLCNPLQWCTTKEWAEAMARQAKLYDHANVKVTKEEQAALEKSYLFFCHINEFETLLSHGYVIWLTITGCDHTHPVVDFLDSYRTKISTNKDKILSYPLREGEKYRDVTGILIQIRLAEELQKWSVAVERGDTPAPFDKGMIIDTVWKRLKSDPIWETYSSTMSTIEHRYGESLRVFRNVSSRQAGNNRPVGDTLRDEMTVVGMQNELARITGGTAGTVQTPGQRDFWDDVSQIPDEIPQALATPRPAPRAPAASPRASAAAPRAPAAAPREQRGRAERVNNWDDDRELMRVWDGLGKQCGTVKAAAGRGEHGVTPLPRSSVAGHTADPMCLNWSVLMWCTAECKEVYDHISQPAEKKAELKQWVQEQAPKVPNRQRRRGRGGNQGDRE